MSNWHRSVLQAIQEIHDVVVRLPQDGGTSGHPTRVYYHEGEVKVIVPFDGCLRLDTRVDGDGRERIAVVSDGVLEVWQSEPQEKIATLTMKTETVEDMEKTWTSWEQFCIVRTDIPSSLEAVFEELEVASERYLSARNIDRLAEFSHMAVLEDRPQPVGGAAGAIVPAGASSSPRD